MEKEGGSHLQYTMDPMYHPGVQQQPVPGSTVGSGYPPPPGCPLPQPPPGYLPPPPLPPGFTAQQQYQPVLPYPPMPPQGYGQYPAYQGWGPYGALYSHNDTSTHCFWCGWTHASAGTDLQRCCDTYKSSTCKSPTCKCSTCPETVCEHATGTWR